MAAGSVLVSFLYLCLYIAGIILVAFLIVWLVRVIFGIAIDGEVMKWGRIFVGLLCLIAIVSWILSVVGIGGSPIYFPPGYQH
jgi:hypothetical protein